ncbi:MAG: hypothetical protein WCA89_04400 [Terracidiphilus sp.]|jgi:hypothetical protein
MKTLRIIVSVLVLTAFSAAFAQQPVLPPPKPADSGPSLAVTMQFIQDKLNDIGKVNFVTFFQDTTDGSTGNNAFTNEVSNVVADQNQCRISLHWKVTKDGSVTSEVSVWFSLRDVQDIVVKPYAQYQSEVNASSGVPNLICTSINPPLTALLVRRPHGVVNLFPFTDADLADRAAKALTHAVELCGGGNKEPF